MIKLKVSKIFSLLRKNAYFFYSFPKMPKFIANDKKIGLIEGLFDKFLLSVSIKNLSEELFSYITNSAFLFENFPILKENEEIYTNFMILHLDLLQNRILDENNSLASKEHMILIYYWKNDYFNRFAKNVNSHIPVQDFANHFMQNYTNRLKEVSSELKEFERRSTIMKLGKDEKLNELRKTLRKIVFFNYFDETHPYIEKISKYYMAHKSYLDSVKYPDMIRYKVYWGLNEDLKFIN